MASRVSRESGRSGSGASDRAETVVAETASYSCTDPVPRRTRNPSQGGALGSRPRSAARHRRGVCASSLEEVFSGGAWPDNIGNGRIPRAEEPGPFGRQRTSTAQKQSPTACRSCVVTRHFPRSTSGSLTVIKTSRRRGRSSAAEVSATRCPITRIRKDASLDILNPQECDRS